VDVSGLLDRRLLIVTGKGGVGKSTVAAALALAGAHTGRKTCLVEIEGRQTMPQLFDTGSWEFKEREFRPGLWGIAIDPEASLREYLDMFYGARRFSRFLTNNSAMEFASTAAPGIKDVLLIGKVKQMERRREPDGRFTFDLIVMDAPPTGRIVNFLRAPDATTELVNVGPIRQQAQSLIDMLLDQERTHLVLVTLLEEMPVAETSESVHALRELGVAFGPVMVNRVLVDRFDGPVRKALDGLDGASLSEVLAGAGVEADADAAETLLQEGQMNLRRLQLQERMRAELTQRVNLPTLELPYLWSDRFGPAQIDALSEVIEELVEG
jgi:anion-transporting  ArsA/GET3 family ATPase